MAIRYVHHAGDGSDPTGGDWTDAHPDLKSAATASSDGDIIRVSDEHNHVESAENEVVSWGATKKLRIVSVDHDDPTVYSAGGSDKSSSSYRYQMSWGIQSNAVVEGLTLGTLGTNQICSFAAVSEESRITFRNCTLYIGSSAGLYDGNSGGGVITYENCTFDGLSSTGMIFYPRDAMFLTLRHCTFTNCGSRTRLIDAAAKWMLLLVEDCDLSWCPTLVATDSGDGQIYATFRRCKLHSSVALASDNNNNYAAHITCEDCSSDAIIARPLPINKHVVRGGTVVSTASVYRQNGASDGENNWSYGVASNALCDYTANVDIPNVLCTDHDASGSKTLTVYCGSDDSGLYDDDVWLEVSYNDDAATAYATGEFISTRPNYGAEQPAGTSTYLKTDASTWSGTVGTKYKFVLTGIDPTEPGPITVRVFVAKPSINFWVCPNLELTAE